MLVAAALFLRWMPHHGWFTITLPAVCLVAAAALSVNRRRRLHRAVKGIHHEQLTPAVAPMAAVSASVVVLAALGILTVLLPPLPS